MSYLGFKALESHLSGHVDNPGAVAASIGRKKYGKQAFQHAAATGTKMEHAKPKKKSPSKGSQLLSAYGK